MLSIGEWMQLAAKFPNVTGLVFAFVGTSVTGLLAYWLKRPLQKRIVEIRTFETQVDGYERLIKAQGDRITFLMSEQTLSQIYEAELVKRLRECEARNLTQMPRQQPC